MFIVSKKSIPLDGSHPTLLYGYGGFGLSITPFFDPRRIVLVKNLSVVFCVASIRGGGEYGEEWHKAGSLANKQKSFDDFIKAAEYLVAEGYTQPKKLCIEGGSNGGLLVGACINQVRCFSSSNYKLCTCVLYLLEFFNRFWHLGTETWPVWLRPCSCGCVRHAAFPQIYNWFVLFLGY